ncbi:radical SAM family heme chaperone HemW [Roseivivax sediminis]|uniref:Heme chaperone HemW n=1 Tax=Roseivivax sediminis TaxID=936889 RepID=A0A1I1U4K3_9RHOB|nr:radical SAM family heme chaperone HemW [Roseivivax sediminis]SFD63633.1 oxygen-independent coproporphyrinogen-3 oxidase [Roseivivax sediminis]
MAEDWQAGGFGLYLHWPFCEAKCPYCDFNSHVVREIDEARWGAAFEAEIARVARRTGPRRLDTVFFGGGTPSLMSPELVDRILTAVRQGWDLSPEAEITLEANPRSVEAGRFRGFASAGVNRLSMGLQALNDSDLRRLGRLHSVAEARAAYDVARDIFPRVSFDLIYARQDQDLAAWEAELREALSMAVDHLSLYQLTIEQGTAFWDRARTGTLRGLPDEDLSADLYDRTQEICDAAGRPAYEVSNHAMPGAESRHNLVYWRYGDYAGIGPGAHGRLTLEGEKRATAGWRNPGAWLEKAETGCGDRVDDPVAPLDQVGEYLMMGMRLLEGIDLDRWEGLAPGSVPQDRIIDMQEMGVLERRGPRLRATTRGRLVLNAVVTELLP